MSSWRYVQEPRETFHDMIYGAEENAGSNDEEEISGEELELGYNEEEDESLHSPSLDRSRSPIRFHSPSTSPIPVEVVLEVDDEDGMPVDGDDDRASLAPDAHSLYASPKERHEGERNKGGRRRGGRRGGRSGVQSVRKRVVRRREGPNRGRRGGNRIVVGNPLTEIWTSNEDVPAELLSLARDEVRSRHMKDALKSENNISERGDASESEDDYKFLNTNDGADGVPTLDGQKLKFEWFPMDSFQGKEELFRPEFTGSVYMSNTAYDAFRLYWDDAILDLIVTETNQYASKIVSASFKSEWYPTNVDEILCLFSFWMMLGIVRMPTVTSCFSVDPLLKTEVFRRIFTRRRYELLTKALNFIDSDPDVNDAFPAKTSAARSLDRIYCLRPIISYLNLKFQSNYVLSKDIYIDESLTPWKGKLDFKQYIRSKASKFGVKTFELCESVTGYVWSFLVYAGKHTAADLEKSPGVLKSTAVVRKLIGPLLNKGYRLFMDDWYNSPLLSRYLKLNGTDCVGTLRPSRRDVPVVINKAPLKKGELIARHSGDVTVLAWQDENRITVSSTCHSSNTALATVATRPKYRPVPFMPQMVLDYNKFMGGVDDKDQVFEPYSLDQKHPTKWYMKLFKRLLNISVLNARILLQSSTQKHQDDLAFRLQLIDSILTYHLSRCPEGVKTTVNPVMPPPNSRSVYDRPGRFVNSTHWPILLQRSESCTARNRNFWKRCVVCLREGRKTQKTSYCCETCTVPLCIRNCFKIYHTVP